MDFNTGNSFHFSFFGGVAAAFRVDIEVHFEMCDSFLSEGGQGVSPVSDYGFRI
jgi:hypothetical protein